MENYFASQRDHIFRNVEVLIYVFDVESREVWSADLFVGKLASQQRSNGRA
jgi:Ras-related GTP-binding protein A/B